MKMKLRDRLILFFGALLAGCAGIFLIICGVRMMHGEAIPTPWLVISLVLGCLCLLLCITLMGFVRKYNNSRHAFVIQQTDNGQLRIAVKAIENLVKKCIGMHEEIHANRLTIHHSRHDITVDLSISLADNISIPLAVASLQKQIKQYLVASSGVNVREVRVSVESTQEEAVATAAPDSPYLVPSHEAQEGEENQKMPVHRRLFGKADQAVTVPEPPAPQEEQPQIPEEPAEEKEAPVQEAAQEEPAEAIPSQEEPQPEYPAEEAESAPLCEEIASAPEACPEEAPEEAPCPDAVAEAQENAPEMIPEEAQDIPCPETPAEDTDLPQEEECREANALPQEEEAPAEEAPVQVEEEASHE